MKTTTSKVTADQVVEAARAVLAAGKGWCGDRAYISDVAAQLGIGLSEAKRALAELNAAGAIYLARADLISVLDQKKVRESHVAHLGADYHFVQVW